MKFGQVAAFVCDLGQNVFLKSVVEKLYILYIQDIYEILSHLRIIM